MNTHEREALKNDIKEKSCLQKHFKDPFDVCIFDNYKGVNVDIIVSGCIC